MAHRRIRFPDIVLIAVISFSSLWLIARNSGRGGYAEIYYKGKLMEKLDLSENRLIAYPASGSAIIVEVKDGAVRVNDSPCPDKLCVKRGFISGKGEEIICVPSRFQIVIGRGVVDAVSR